MQKNVLIIKINSLGNILLKCIRCSKTIFSNSKEMYIKPNRKLFSIEMLLPRMSTITVKNISILAKSQPNLSKKKKVLIQNSRKNMKGNRKANMSQNKAVALKFLKAKVKSLAKREKIKVTMCRKFSKTGTK